MYALFGMTEGRTRRQIQDSYSNFNHVSSKGQESLDTWEKTKGKIGIKQNKSLVFLISLLSVMSEMRRHSCEKFLGNKLSMHMWCMLQCLYSVAQNSVTQPQATSREKSLSCLVRRWRKLVWVNSYLLEMVWFLIFHDIFVFLFLDSESLIEVEARSSWEKPCNPP